MAMTEEDLITMRDDLIRNRSVLEQAQMELDQKEQVMGQALKEYEAVNAEGLRYATGFGLPLAGAAVGAKYGRPIVGGLAGVAAGIGANVGISAYMNKKHPERPALQSAYADAEDAHDEAMGQYGHAKDWYELSRNEAVDAARTNPAMWGQVTDGVEGYPAKDFQLAMLGRKRQEQAELMAQKQYEQKLQQLALQERQHAVTGLGKQNVLTDEEIAAKRLGHQMTNEDIRSKQLGNQKLDRELNPPVVEDEEEVEVEE